MQDSRFPLGEIQAPPLTQLLKAIPHQLDGSSNSGRPSQNSEKDRPPRPPRRIRQHCPRGLWNARDGIFQTRTCRGGALNPDPWAGRPSTLRVAQVPAVHACMYMYYIAVD